MQSTALRPLEQLTGPTATRLTGWTGTGPITPARLWKNKNTQKGRDSYIDWHPLVQTVDISDFVLTAECFPIQTMTNCVLYRPNEWIVFVYMETQQHSWIALTNQAQRGLQCRCLPKERPAAHSGWQTGSRALSCGWNFLMPQLTNSVALFL